MVGPDKHGIYPEFMNQNFGHPGLYRYFDKIKLIYEYAGIKVIDNFNAIKKAKDLLLLFKSGINLLTRFGKTNPINFDKNLNSISGSLSNKKAA